MTAVAQHPVARNDPCPCGSGRRYKDCHGSLRSETAVSAPSAAAKSRYRPAGDDWASIGAEDQDRLGALMERALVEQKAGRVRDAERLYRAVLEEAPRTHDALHMLGVVRLGLGDFTDAERLLKQAMALRPEYPAIATNWSIVQRSIAARDRRGIETVSEHALPLLVETLARARAAVTSTRLVRAEEGASFGAHEARDQSKLPLHIVAPATDVAGDATWLTRRLRALLAPLRGTFWNASEPPADGEWGRVDARKIDAATRRYPRNGVVVLAGVDGEADAGLREPIDRVLVFVQRGSPSIHLERLRRIAADGARSLTLVFDSHARARRFGGPHSVVPPPIDVAQWPARRGDDRFHPGMLRIATCGQDRLGVHAPNDAEQLCAIAKAAGRLDLFDPGPLREAVGTSRAVVCVPGDPHDRAADIARCDVYLHRSTPWWAEDPRVLFGAMLAGVGVLCPRASVYAEYVTDGVDGWLYDDYDDVPRLVATLRNEPERARAVGEAARRSALARFEPNALAAAYTALVEEWMRAG